LEDDRQLVASALAGDATATRRFVHAVLPVVQARVARVLVKRRGGSGRDVRQDVEDLAQEVFASLFASDARILRAWDPSRGLSLASFCGLVAEREVASILRSGKRSPWKEAATEMDDLERDLGTEPGAEPRIASREQLDRLVDRLRESLSPRGLEMFQRLIVDEEPAEKVAAACGMTTDAVYAWKSRLGKLVRKLATEIASSDPNVPVSETSGSPRRSSEETG
jgi:RNA polymerase sigma-70 factor (ECF subfamily)